MRVGKMGQIIGKMRVGEMGLNQPYFSHSMWDRSLISQKFISHMERNLKDNTSEIYGPAHEFLIHIAYA